MRQSIFIVGRYLTWCIVLFILDANGLFEGIFWNASAFARDINLEFPCDVPMCIVIANLGSALFPGVVSDLKILRISSEQRQYSIETFLESCKIQRNYAVTAWLCALCPVFFWKVLDLCASETTVLEKWLHLANGTSQYQHFHYTFRFFSGRLNSICIK